MGDDGRCCYLLPAQMEDMHGLVAELLPWMLKKRVGGSEMRSIGVAYSIYSQLKIFFPAMAATDIGVLLPQWVDRGING